MPAPGMHAAPLGTPKQQQQDTRPLGPFAPAAGTSSTVTIKNVDMPEEMQEHVLGLARDAVQFEKSLRDIAGHIKRAFDAKYGPTWHCVVGKSFGSFCTHETRSFIFFYVDALAVMLFKTT